MSKRPSTKDVTPIFEAIFNGHMPKSPSSLVKDRFSRFLPWGCAIFIHLALVILARQTEPSLESWSARVAALIHQDLAEQAPMAVEDFNLKSMQPPPPPPPPEVKSSSVVLPPPLSQKTVETVRQKSKTIKRNSRSRSKVTSASSAPAPAPAPAQAAKIITVETNPNVPLDLTQEVFVTGTTNQYAGGVTTQTGTSTQFIASINQTPLPSIPTVTPATPSKARSVGLASGAWQCAWPQRAMAKEIYEQSVTLRVTVQADGHVTNAKVIHDPGDGFGEAAIACALNTKFSPALNRKGKAIKAESPPIKVRFTR